MTNRPGKFSFQIDDSRAAFSLVANGVCYGCIVNSRLASAAGALGLLSKIRDRFELAFSKAERDFAPPGMQTFSRFSTEIDRLIREL